MDSYLDGDYLSGLSDDMGSDVDAGNATVALSPATGEHGTPSTLIRLPGGIIMEKKTLWIILGVIVAAVIYFKMRKGKAPASDT